MDSSDFYVYLETTKSILVIHLDIKRDGNQRYYAGWLLLLLPLFFGALKSRVVVIVPTFVPSSLRADGEKRCLFTTLTGSFCLFVQLGCKTVPFFALLAGGFK